MSIKTILVYLPDPERAKEIAAFAVRLAEQHGAHLIGLHVIPDIRVYGSVAVELAGDLLEHQRKALRAHAEEIEAIFAELTRAREATSEWRCDGRPHASAVSEAARQARSVDLVITGQVPSNQFAIAEDMPAQLIFGSGRPVLVLPHSGHFEGVGNNVLIAWNESREAARAAFDALPLIRHGGRVRVLSVNPHERHDDEPLAPGEELALALARHGLNCEATVSITDELSPGEELLSRAADFGADLLVMGCYGHSRLREVIFGGVTRRILASMTVPVLMSH